MVVTKSYVTRDRSNECETQFEQPTGHGHELCNPERLYQNLTPPRILLFDSTDLRLPHDDARYNIHTGIVILSHSPHRLSVRRGDYMSVTVVYTIGYHSNTNPKSIVKNKHHSSLASPAVDARYRVKLSISTRLTYLVFEP
jgi:hypothetical protein